MTDPSDSAPPLTLGRGLRILELQMVQASGIVDAFDFAQNAFTVLTGARNSSKTTTLKAIDFCLGGSGSVSEELGAAIDEKYVAFLLVIAVNGRRHSFRRDFTQGVKGKILRDDVTLMSPAEAQGWLMATLAWPQLRIPFGRVAATAVQQVPLTFRSIFRHIYRKEDSWTDFAAKEQEYLRRAVISLLLGFAPNRYENAEFELGQALRAQSAAEAVLRDVVESTEVTVRNLVRELSLPVVVNTASLSTAEATLRESLERIRTARDALVAEAGSASRGSVPPGLDADLPSRLEAASLAASEAAERAAMLNALLEEHLRSQAMVRADAARFDRLIDAVAVFEEIPVQVCPACEQDVDHVARRHAESCYLCQQVVGDDARTRRADREKRALESELADLVEAIERTQADLSAAQAVEAAAANLRVSLARGLHDSRATALAPFMARLEDLSVEAGRVEQQLAAIPALAQILSRRSIAEQSLAAAASEVDRCRELAAADAALATTALESCATFADRMNIFLRGFSDRVWVEGEVTISADDLTFFVGTRPWGDNLGAEARVVFFLAYSYALLYLDRDLPARSMAPGLLILDNPYQQGIDAAVVAAALNRLGSAAADLGVQLIVTQARAASNLVAPHVEIQMPTEYSS